MAKESKKIVKADEVGVKDVQARGVRVHAIWNVEASFSDLGFAAAAKDGFKTATKSKEIPGVNLIPDVTALLSKKGGRHEALVVLRLSVAPKTQPTFEARVAYAGHYSIEDGAAIELEKFAWSNGIANLVPYVRQHLAHLTSTSAYAPYLLPPINIRALVEAVNARKKQK